MIEGKFDDVSLPGLLQFLASEPRKNYHVEVSTGNQQGQIFVCGGSVVSSSFGLLEGEDALSEFLSWNEGTFGVDVLNPQFEIKRNLKIPIIPTTSFVEQTAYLVNESVGLNTSIKQSQAFGTQEWQQSLYLQPLEREDFVTLSWVGDGRSMRQAMREFNFDILKATSVLFRLLTTNSVQVIRPGTDVVQSAEKASVDVDLPESFGLYANANGRRVAAVSLSGGVDLAAAAFALNIDESAGSDSAEIYDTDDGGVAAGWNPVSERQFLASELFFDQHDTGENQKVKTKIERAASEAVAPSLAGAVSAGGVSAGAEAVAANRSTESTAANTSVQSDQVESVLATTSAVVAPAVPVVSGSAPVPVSEAASSSVPVSAVPAEPAQLPGAAAASPEPPKKPNWKFAGADPARTHSLPTLERPKDTGGAANTVPGGKAVPPLTPRPFTPARSASSAYNEPAIRRTVVLPLVTLDIERLLQSTFTLTQFGKLALTNPSLEISIRQTLADVQGGKKLVTVIGENARPPKAILSVYKYCLDRGYIESVDQVIQHTAELLLGRLEIEQYLLQRRRITGDELRDLLTVSRSEGIKLAQLLVRSGYLTAGDLDTLNREQTRFLQGGS